MELPLSGASIFIIVANSNSQVEGAAAMKETIQALGGTPVEYPSRATHALWVSDEQRNPLEADAPDDWKRPPRPQPQLSSSVQEALEICNKLQIPIVTTQWLERISGLRPPNEHWSHIPVESFVPDIVDVASQHRRDKATHLAASIRETYQYLADQNPHLAEEEAIRRAVELSLLDWALVTRSSTGGNNNNETSSLSATPSASSHEVLGVTRSASRTEIKAAFRRRALETHPDKGGSQSDFELVARAYRCLLQQHDKVGVDVAEPPSDADARLKSTAHWDAELRDHRGLVQELFQNHGADLDANVAHQEEALKALNLSPRDAGASNVNEQNDVIRNSCFYLSLASSYLDGIGALSSSAMDGNVQDAAMDKALTGETALDLKRVIEAAVVHAHPEWPLEGLVGEEIQAFSDFLVYVLDSPTMLSDWAVAIFDTSSGFVDVYKGKNYADLNDDWARSCTIVLRYVPGHYQPLLPMDQSTTRPTLQTLLETLDSAGVLYVVTDGTA